MEAKKGATILLANLAIKWSAPPFKSFGVPLECSVIKCIIEILKCAWGLDPGSFLVAFANKKKDPKPHARFKISMNI